MGTSLEASHVWVQALEAGAPLSIHLVVKQPAPPQPRAVLPEAGTQAGATFSGRNQQAHLGDPTRLQNAAGPSGTLGGPSMSQVSVTIPP